MSKPVLQAVNPPAEEENVHLDLEGELAGHWVEYKRRLTARQTIALLRAQEDYASALEAVGERVVKHSFGGDLLDQPVRTVALIVQAWNMAAEAAALDPTSAVD